MLILLHTFIYIVGNYTSSIHPNSNHIPELLFLSSLAQICLGLASCQNICVELMAKFVQLVNLCSFCENPQTIKIFHYHADAIIWLFPRGPSHMLAHAKNPQSAGRSDFRPISCVRKSDTRMP